MCRTSDATPSELGRAEHDGDSTLSIDGVATLPDLLVRAARLYGRRPAIDFLGRRWTWRSVLREVEKVAAGLQAIGLKPGERVGLCLPNTPYYVIAYYAVLRAGGIVVNYNPLYVERELEHQVRDSGTTIMVVVDLKAIHSKIAAVAERTDLRKIVVCRFGRALPPSKSMMFRLFRGRDVVAHLPKDGRHVDYVTLARTRGPICECVLRPDDIALLQYTGGTTGIPKAAMLSHANLIANTAQNEAYDPTRKAGYERVLGVLPLFHVFAMTVVMNASVHLGSEMILLPRFDVADTLKTIMRRKPTTFPAVPTIYAAIAQAAQAKHLDLSFISSCISGGAPLPMEVGDLFMKVANARLVEGYGLTEASPVVTCNPSRGVVKYGSIGLPLVHTIVEIRDPDTRALCPSGERGEIVVRGPQVMRGYWNNPEETDNVLDTHGLRTGDIGYKDDDGYVYVVDRIKDLILSGGYNVYPRTIEDALYQHPDVVEAIVIGIPDRYRGEAAKAFVVLRPAAKATAGDLQVFLVDYLSKIERPKEIEIRKTLPKTGIGKPSRKELVAEEAERRNAS